MTENQGGTDEWMERWINLYGDRLVRYVFIITRDRELAQDVVQESFLKLMLFHRRHPNETISPGWLFKVARNQAFDAMKTTILPTDHVPDQPSDDTHIWLPIQMRQILSELPVLDRECLWLFYYADWPTKDIAHHLGISPGALRGRLLRSRRRLQQLWEVKDHECEFPK